MSRPSFSVDQYLLNLSGVLAIALCAWVSIRYYNPLQSAVVYSLFTAAFITESFAKPLGVRPRISQVCILLMLMLSIAALVINRDTVALILAVVIMASAPHHFSARSSWLLLAAANIGYGLVFVWTQTPVADYLYSWLTLFALQAFAITSSLARESEVRTQQELARKNSELLAARAVMARQSKADERLRIAGDLHDSIGHRLTALQLQLEVLAHETPLENKAQVDTCQVLAKDLLEEVRTIVRQMSQDESNDLADAVAELEALTPGVELVVVSDLPELKPEFAQQLVFCIQEAAHNAIRHGRANRIEIRYFDSKLSIEDNGIGLGGKDSAPGFGLKNINTRLAPWGGSARLEQNGLLGCELQIQLPAQALKSAEQTTS